MIGREKFLYSGQEPWFIEIHGLWRKPLHHPLIHGFFYHIIQLGRDPPRPLNLLINQDLFESL